MEQRRSKIRLVVSDVDGTLVGNDCVMEEGMKELSRLLREQGIAFTLASGRPVGMMRQYMEALDITLPVIASNGAAGYEKGAFIWKEILPGRAVRTAAEEADRLGLAVFLNDGITEGVYRQNDYTRRQTEKTGLYETVIHPEGDEWETIELQKLMIIDPDSPGRCDELRELLKERENGIYVVRYGDRCFEAMPEGCSKGSGIRRLADYLGIHPGEILAVGDNINDLDMFEAAGWSAAVGNAAEELKKRADYVCRGETVQGVIEAVRHFILEGKCGEKTYIEKG